MDTTLTLDAATPLATESADRIAALTVWAKNNPVPGLTVDELVAAAQTLEA